MIKKIEKKGGGHIEIILSFVIFIGFISFILYFLNPFQQQDLTEGYLQIIENRILENISTELVSITLVLDENEENCVSIKSPLSEKRKDYNLISKNQKEKIITSSAQNPKGKVLIKPNNENVFFLYFNEDFVEHSDNLDDCEEIEPDKYQFGMRVLSQIVSLPRINESKRNLKERFNEEYNELKEKIGLPASIEFDLMFYDLKGNLLVNLDKTAPRTTVYSKRVPIRILDKDGEMVYGFMNIRVW
jgi:lipopolysaccharide export LptBFGC system permease protein LptF